MTRRPVSSRSSRVTTSALSRQLCATMCRRQPWSRARIASAFSSRPVEEVGVEDHAVLDHLGQAAAQLAVGKGGEGLGVDPDADGLVEGADDVLGAGVVDPHLAPDGAIDLGQQRGRDHQQGEAAEIRRGDEPGEVADDASAQRDDAGVAIGAEPDQVVVQVGGAVERLGRLARGEDGERRRDPDRRQRRGVGSLEARDVLVGDQQCPAARAARPGRVERLPRERAEGVGPAADDPDLVRTGAQVHAHGDFRLGRE